MADANGDVKQTKLDDSNMANYGSKEHVDARKKAAETEKEYKGAGTKVGLEIWRVENKRTASDTPDFGVKRWPVKEYGNFHVGDCYIVLNTYLAPDPLTGKPSKKLAWDVHFWLGNESSQDEKGVAAYKTVELDDLLNDGPVQHRECQAHESKLFQSYFKQIVYKEGGIASGFRAVTAQEYTSKMYRIRKTAAGVRAFPVPVSISSLDKGDCFVLDAGLKVTVYCGSQADAFEKLKAGELAHNIVGGRNGKAKKIPEPDQDFWKALGGTEKDIKATADQSDVDLTPAVDPLQCSLFQLSDASGRMQFTKVQTGNLKKSMLNSSDVFILDTGASVFVWIGKNASKGEKSQSMKYADDYLKDNGLPGYTSITSLNEGQLDLSFDFCFGGKDRDIKAGGTKPAKSGGFCIIS